jgi:predicted MPP superfamily phosphohydrolase
MPYIYLVILTLGALGHVILWVGLVNRAHGFGIGRRWVTAITALGCTLFAAIPVAVAVAIGSQGALRPAGVASAIAWEYLAVCAIVCVVAAIQRWRWHLHPERRCAVLSNHTSHINLVETVAGPLTAPGIPTWLSRLPGNEALTICLQEKQLAIPRLTPAYEGLRIVHISDLHMSGRISKAYFERVVEEVNRSAADLVAITGDLVEREDCLDWIPDTLGRLDARDGVYYVLGNHDRHVRKQRLTAALADAGLVHLGGTWRKLTIRHTPVILAGNELPWHRPAADLRDCPERDAKGLPLRIVLTHSPDQFGWAQANDVDLLLAGHNHGGQACLPLLGPIVAPSLHGVRYASGAFSAGNTVLHVSRGTSSLTPLRWNCPPEIAVLNLRSAEQAECAV